MSEKKGMKPIWYFVGLLVLIIGVIILSSGLYHAAYPPSNPAALYHIHPDIWWGSIMMVFGAILLWINRNKTVA